MKKYSFVKNSSSDSKSSASFSLPLSLFQTLIFQFARGLIPNPHFQLFKLDGSSHEFCVTKSMQPTLNKVEHFPTKHSKGKVAHPVNIVRWELWDSIQLLWAVAIIYFHKLLQRGKNKRNPFHLIAIAVNPFQRKTFDWINTPIKLFWTR